MNNLTLVQQIAIWILPVLFAITVHEAAHGFVANRLGDKTALMMGRVTLNPIRHIDLVGTIIVPLACLAGGSLLGTGGFIFGWAKPVPVDWRNLRNPKRDSALVAIAGPLSNLVMAFLWALIAKLGSYWAHQAIEPALFLAYAGAAGISINIVLMLLNLLPIPPLDGSRVVSSLLPYKAAIAYGSIERYGFIILILLVATNSLSVILTPAYQAVQGLIFSLV